MRSRKPHTESLWEIVFRDRNKEYGAFVLRRKYFRTLLLALIAGTVLFLMGTIIPLLYYAFSDRFRLSGTDVMFVVDYLPMEPPAQEDMNQLAKALARPKEEKAVEPVVSDTVPPEQELKPPAETPPPEETEHSDTLPEGHGGMKDGTGSAEATGIATVIDIFPRYPGGDDARLAFLRRNVRYPVMALKTGVQGTVIVVFIIETDGSVSNVKIEKGIGGGCDEEAARVAALMPRWEPGKRQARPVRVMVRMPIIFRIPGRPA
jgi:protein TonB